MNRKCLHLDVPAPLSSPACLVYCPPKLIDGLPMSLRDWDKVEVIGSTNPTGCTNGRSSRVVAVIILTPTTRGVI